LSERRITHVVSVCTDPVPADSPQSGLTQLRIPIEDVDYHDLLIWFPTAVRFIHQAIQDGGVVLVHSAQGISRGAAVVAAYGKYALFPPFLI
jgi:dual specificity phosphatase 12